MAIIGDQNVVLDPDAAKAAKVVEPVVSDVVAVAAFSLPELNKTKRGTIMRSFEVKPAAPSFTGTPKGTPVALPSYSSASRPGFSAVPVPSSMAPEV